MLTRAFIFRSLESGLRSSGEERGLISQTAAGNNSHGATRPVLSLFSYYFSVLLINNVTYFFSCQAHSLPMFREKRFRSKKKVKEADRKDPVKSHRPDLPVTGPGEWFTYFLNSILR